MSSSSINNNPSTQQQIALLLQQQLASQNNLANDLNSQSAIADTAIPAVPSAAPLTGGTSSVSSDVLGLLVQAQNVTNSSKSTPTLQTLASAQQSTVAWATLW